MRKVILQRGDSSQSVEIESEIHFRTLDEFNGHFQKLFEKCPESFKSYELAFSESAERWMPVEEYAIGNWLSLKTSTAPEWYIRPITQETMRDHVAHGKLETVVDSVHQMRAYIEEEMDEIKVKTEEEVAKLRGEIWALKLKLDSMEKESKATEDVDDIEEAFPVSHSSPKKSNVHLKKPEQYATFIQFRVPAGSTEALIPKHVISCISHLNSAPVVYAVTSGEYETCFYATAKHDKVYRRADQENFCIAISEADLQPAKPKSPTTKPKVVTYAKAWIPENLVKSEKNFPAFKKSEVDDVTEKVNKFTFSEEFLKSANFSFSAKSPKQEKQTPFSFGVGEQKRASFSDVGKTLAEEFAALQKKSTEKGPVKETVESPDSTQYSMASHTSPKKAEYKAETPTPAKCNGCEKTLEKTQVHCVECGDFNCCQECFKTANSTHPKDHTFELYIYP